jgi:hypothetical protein
MLVSRLNTETLGSVLYLGYLTLNAMFQASGEGKKKSEKSGGEERRKKNYIGPYRFGLVQHPNAEIPQQQPAVVAYAAESVCAVIAPPGVETHARYPRVVAFAARNDAAFRKRPDRYQIVLSTREDISSVRRPANAHQPAVVAAVDIQQSKQDYELVSSRVDASRMPILLLDIVEHP